MLFILLIAVSLASNISGGSFMMSGQQSQGNMAAGYQLVESSLCGPESLSSTAEYINLGWAVQGVLGILHCQMSIERPGMCTGQC